MISKNDRERKVETSAVVRELPHNIEIERAILGVLLDGRHATAMHVARQKVQHPLAFFHRDHRIVYHACLEIDDAGNRVDATSVQELLGRYDFKAVIERLRQQEMLLDRNELDLQSKERLRELNRRSPGEAFVDREDSALAAVGGMGAINDLVASFAPVSGLEQNLSLLWDHYLKRRMITRLQALCDKTYRTPDLFPKLVDEGSQIVLELGKHNQSAAVHHIGSVVDETLDAIQHRHDNPSEGIKTGIDDLDQMLVSLRPGGLYVLAARPGQGKTSLALDLVKNIAGQAENPAGVLFFSLEVDRVDLVKKLLASSAGIDFRALELGLLEPHQQQALTDSASSFKNWQLDLMDVSDLKVATLRSLVKRRQLESEGALKAIVVDYLQLLSGSRNDMTEYEKVSEISRVLKVVAREMRIPVIALSQMSRDSEKGVGTQPREPRLSDLRGSGTIEQDADAVIFIHRTDAEDLNAERRKMKIIVAKNRFGPTGFTMMDFYPAKMRFIPAPTEDAAPRFAPNPNRRTRQDSAPQDDEDVLA